ncbi:unnamed protein product [Diabrotica balteata]|uniref:Uncharacterized protein n=1 Tax=Diabrotica balteata TaxID=107213 RepID=A0A9N9T241_DIABA|nr:unnamed protein product [Diabrotica balteata]
MKIVIVLTALFIGDINCNSDHSVWTEFKTKHSKNYSVHEEQTRFSVFQENLRKIEQHNARYKKGEVSYFLNITKFADWTKEEVQKFLKPLPKNQLAFKTVEQNPVGADYPTSFDWRDHGAVSEIQDQGLCLSGWAFAAAGAVEGRYAALKKELIALSSEELIDCSTYENPKCDKGGIAEYSYYYIQGSGLSSAEQYPYTATNSVPSTCYGKNITNKPIQPFGNFGTIQQTEDAIKGFIADLSPISTHVQVIEDWLLYGGGVYDNPKCGNGLATLNHGILAVGYGVDEKEGKEYFTLKNSWGSDWGEEGYIRVVRNKKQCGISTRASFPILWFE